MVGAPDSVERTVVVERYGARRAGKTDRRRVYNNNGATSASAVGRRTGVTAREP
jgi:hypothetical protein